MRASWIGLLAIFAGGCAGAGATATPVVPLPTAAPTATPVSGPAEEPWRTAAGGWRREADRKRAHERWRRAELRRLRRSRTVTGALRRALLARHIDRARHDRLRRDYLVARAAVGRLPGLRRAELAAVVGAAESLAAARRLTPGRFEPVFLLLRRNTAYWARSPRLPAPAERVTWGDDPAVFQYYPGRGLQLQPLASWGRVNALAHACLRMRRGRRCPRRELERSLDRLLALGSHRSGFLAWEHYFAWGGGTPPWISGMTQGTAIQALARGARVLGERRFRRAAGRALGAFEHPAPDGVAIAVPGGRAYVMYSFSPGLRILNGELQAITGLRDLAVLGRSRRARRLFRRGEPAARRAVAAFDTGAWSLYSASGRESNLGYHRLVGEFLGNLCTRTGARTYCGAARRFSRYEREPPRIHLARLRGMHARRRASVRFSLSKLAHATVRVWGPRRLVLQRELDLARGAHAVGFTPPARGRYRVRIDALGPSGPRGVRARTVRVVLPKPEPKRKLGRPCRRPVRSRAPRRC
jgi:hypothetical protein